MTESPVLQRQPQTSLESFCHYFDNNETTETGEVEKFVGLRYQNKKLDIYFPVGYNKPEDYPETNLTDEKEKCYRKDILNLISILTVYGKKDEKIFQSDLTAKTSNAEFPIHAYLFIISDFLNHGYFKQKESYYKKGTSGKINWSRTIKQVRPQIINDNIYYFNFVTKHIDYNQDDLISKIHQYCVYECFTKLGYLFCSYVPEKPAIKLNKKLFTSVIKSKAATTFNENSLLLFKNMIDVINFLDEDNEKQDFVYGTNSFHTIWESLVDEVYGESDKDKFYPKVYWKIDGKEYCFENQKEKYNSLRPDTIMITNRGSDEQKIFVLDSKYYRYGDTKNPNHLPGSDSIVKQIAYATYIDKKSTKLPKDVASKTQSNKIFNAFIMPAKDEKKENQCPENIGFASSDFVKLMNSDITDKPYYKIHGILLDVRTLMHNHRRHNDESIKILAKAIESL